MPPKFKYLIAGLAIYSIAACCLYFAFRTPLDELLVVFLIFGVVFSAVAFFLTKNIAKPLQKPAFQHESWLLPGLIALIVFYLTFGGTLINTIFPKKWLDNPQSASIIIFLKKLLVFVIIPSSAYRFWGFTLADFGLKNAEVKFPGKQTTFVFIFFSIAILSFQYFLSNGAKTIRTGHFTSLQLLAGLPLCYIYLVFDAGLIEEFFFRGLLQSRLSSILKSSTGGIICSAVIFGLVHSPGLFLRGAAGEGMEQPMPYSFWAAYTVVFMGVAGIFLGIIYDKTKNLWLCMAIHAMVDLLPNFSAFANTWHLSFQSHLHP